MTDVSFSFQLTKIDLCTLVFIEIMSFLKVKVMMDFYIGEKFNWFYHLILLPCECLWRSVYPNRT